MEGIETVRKGESLKLQSGGNRNREYEREKRNRDRKTKRQRPFAFQQFSKLTLCVSTLPADLDDDACVGDDDDGERDEVEEGDTEHRVGHLPAVVGVEEAERHALVEVWVGGVRLHVEDDALKGKTEAGGSLAVEGDGEKGTNT